MRHLVLALLAGATLVSCATQQPSVHKISVPFDLEEASRLNAEGENTIKGNAFIREGGGGVVTCAGERVFLIPATDYATQRMLAIYNNVEEGFVASQASRNLKFDPDPLEYYELIRSTMCDSRGDFAFDHVADGEFFITVRIGWQAGLSPQGGNLMHRVSARFGHTVSVIMAP